MTGCFIFQLETRPVNCCVLWRFIRSFITLISILTTHLLTLSRYNVKSNMNFKNCQSRNVVKDCLFFIKICIYYKLSVILMVFRNSMKDFLIFHYIFLKKFKNIIYLSCLKTSKNNAGNSLRKVLILMKNFHFVAIIKSNIHQIHNFF